MSKDPEYRKKYYRLHREEILAKMKEYRKKYPERVKENKKKCKRDPEKSRQYYLAHRDEILGKRKEYIANCYQENKERLRPNHRANQKRYYSKHREEILADNKIRMKRYLATPEGKKRASESVKKYAERTRMLALVHYGGNPPRCACCGESHKEFLCIDHIKGGGTKHKKEIGGASQIFTWLMKNNYPEGFRVLCDNCNTSFGHYHYCPHQKEGTSGLGSDQTPAR